MKEEQKDANPTPTHTDLLLFLIMFISHALIPRQSTFHFFKALIRNSSTFDAALTLTQTQQTSNLISLSLY